MKSQRKPPIAARFMVQRIPVVDPLHGAEMVKYYVRLTKQDLAFLSGPIQSLHRVLMG